MSGRLQEASRSSAGESSYPLLAIEDSGTSVGTASVSADHSKPDLTRTDQPVQGRPAVPLKKDIYPRFMSSNAPRAKVYTPAQRKTAWSDTAKTVQECSDQMVEQWHKEIDTYLVFAGLFSAILTAFNVQSYILLQSDSSQQNSTQTGNLWISRASAVWLNGLWFSGLVLSLAPAFLAIMSKQWLDEFSKGLSGASRSVARERQYRLNNLKKWRVGDIVDLIPLLLQLALTCFLAGLLILLWTLHHTLAIIMSGLVGVLATFVITTALLPLFIPSCAYLSPQTHMIDNIFQPNHFESWLSSTSATKQPKSGPSSVSQGTGSDPESTSPPQGRRCPDWITDIWLSWSVKGLKIVQTLKDRPTRQGREQSAIKDVSSELDIQLLVEACSFTLRPEPVSATAVCLTAVEDKDVLLFFQQLRKSTRAHFGATADASSGPIGRGNQHQLLWLQVMLCVVSTGDTSLSSKDIDTLGLYAHWGQWPPNMNDVEVEWAGFCLSSIMECLQESITRGEQPTYQPSFLDGMMQAFLSNVISRKASSRKVVWQVIASSYRAVRLSESLLAKRPSDNALRVSHGYAGNVRRFLERANRALTSQPTGVDGSYLEKIRTYTGDVLTEVARNLSKLPTTRFYANLFYYDLVDSLADQMTLDGPGVLQCIPSDSVPDFICMLEQLAARVEEDPPLWSSYKPALDALMRQVKLGVAGESIVNPLTLITVHGNIGRIHHL